MIKLTIAIPTVVGREHKLELLVEELRIQVQNNKLSDFVEILIDSDNKEISIGAKRQRMYRHAEGLFTVQIDDDDWVAPDFVKLCYEGTLNDVDCIGYQEHCDLDGIIKYSDLSLNYESWAEFKHPQNGFHHVRTPFFKTPIKTSICLEAGVKDLRWGEDHDFAKRIYPLLKKEHYINKPMYFYRYKPEPHKEKYGIR